MAKGTTTFSTKSREVKKFVFEPPPVGQHTGKVDLSNLEIGKTQSGLPSITFRVELLDCPNASGNNHKVRHMLYPWLKTGKDGVELVDRDGQVTQLAKALGSELEGIGVSERTDADGNRIPVLDANAIVKWLRSFDGATVLVDVKHEYDRNDKSKVYGRINRFEPSEESEDLFDDVDEDEDDFDEEEEDELDDEDDDEDEEEDDDESDFEEPEPEPEPVKKTRAKAAPKTTAAKTKATKRK